MQDAIPAIKVDSVTAYCKFWMKIIQYTSYIGNMSNNTVLNGVSVSGGDTLATEDTGLGYKIPRGKVVIGNIDIDGGDVSSTNPMPVETLDNVGNVVRIANDETIILLRKMVKLMETLAVIDWKQRQRVVMEAIGNTTAPYNPTEINTTLPVTIQSGTITNSVGNVQLVNSTAGVGYIYPNTMAQAPQQYPQLPIDQRWEIIDRSRDAYSNAIRSKLAFS